MSVAFRRESDDEHLEPKFDRPIPPGPNLVTPRGLALIEAEVTRLEAIAPEAVSDAKTALDRDLRYWRARLATARIAPRPSDGEAGIGSQIRYRMGSADHAVEIVGSDEADPEHGRIAFTAPLARALIGSGDGDILPFAGQADAIEIVEVIDPA